MAGVEGRGEEEEEEEEDEEGKNGGKGRGKVCRDDLEEFCVRNPGKS